MTTKQNGPSNFGPKLSADPLCRVVLIEPLIPENTGNISRTCVGTGSELHLVGPMGFEINESRVKRAGLDYWSDLAWTTHVDYSSWRDQVAEPRRVFLIETTGKRSLYEAEFQRGDILVFGKETSGLDPAILTEFDGLRNSRSDSASLFIPMPGTTRSLNLSNSVAICVFELLRQTSRI